MTSHAFFLAEDAQPLRPFGVCACCSFREDPMVSIFWPVTDIGPVCPTCSGEEPSEGYGHFLLIARKDQPGQLPTLHGPYSAAEAERNRAYFVLLDNVRSAEVIPPEDA